MYKLGDKAIYIGDNGDLKNKEVEIVGMDGSLYTIVPVDGTKLWYTISVAESCLSRTKEKGNVAKD